jgi:hypothetical protein
VMFRLPITHTTDACQWAINSGLDHVQYLTLSEPLITSSFVFRGRGERKPATCARWTQIRPSVWWESSTGLLPRCHDRDAARHGPHLPIKASIRAARRHGRTPKKKARRASLYLTAWLLTPSNHAASNRPPSRADLIGPPLQTNSSPQQQRSQVRLKPRVA